MMGVCEEALFKWEADTCEPHVRMYPKVIAFLGYEPWPMCSSLGERLLAERRRRGLSAKRAARYVGVEPTTFSKWENDLRIPARDHARRCDEFLAGADRSPSHSEASPAPAVGLSDTFRANDCP